MPTQNKHSSHIRSAVQINPLAYKLTKAQQLQKTSTHKLINSSTLKLKLLSFILQCRSNFCFVLAKIWVKKQVNIHYFYPFMPWRLSIFKPRTCILHHFAFLVWLATRIFSTPNTHFQPPKPYFLNAILPFLAMCFIARKGFVYTIAVYFYAYRLAFSSIFNCIQQHFALRLAPKCNVFST